MTQVTGGVQAGIARQQGGDSDRSMQLLAPAQMAFRALQQGARTMEVDLRLTGLIAALVGVWLGFGWASNGLFLTSRNFYDVSVQSVPVAIMATGMVLIIVSRNIDLSVGSIMGLTAYLAAMTQRIWLTENLHIPTASPEIWIIALLVALIVGALIGAVQGSLVAYIGVPSFIVTLGGLLIWRGLIFKIQQGQTIAPLDRNFAILGGNLSAGSAISPSGGAIGFWPTWIVGILACVGIVYALISSRRKRREYGFPVRPQWALAILVVGGCAALVAAVLVYNGYSLPTLLAQRYAAEHGLDPNLEIPVGLAVPVLILLAVGLIMGYLTTRRQFGRYVFAIGGNPEAATLAGINTKRTVVGTFVLMGMLCALAGCLQASRLDAGVTSTGTNYELLVIAAAVIGGTSFSGGIGTIQGAIVGAFLMQSLKAGMVTVGLDSPMQDVAIGCVLIFAVGLDTVARSGQLAWTDAFTYPISVSVPEGRAVNRLWGIPMLGVIARSILAIPHLIVLWAISLLLSLGSLILWIPILVSGKVPQLWCRIVSEYLKRSTRVTAYTLLFPGPYPALGLNASGPVRVDVEIDDRTINRVWGIPVVGLMARCFVVVPQLIILAILTLLVALLMLVLWIPILVNGRYPELAMRVMWIYLNYYARVTGYASLLPVAYPPM
jgi:D-xylose transport system permease protein